MNIALGIEVTPAKDLKRALAVSDVCVTCTPSRKPFLRLEDVPSGMFIAAIGADSPDKQELEAELVAASKGVAAIWAQTILVGETHHAIAAGLLRAQGGHA